MSPKQQQQKTSGANMCVCLVRLEAYKLTQPRTINLAATNRDLVAAACVFFLFANLSNLTIWQAANEWK